MTPIKLERLATAMYPGIHWNLKMGGVYNDFGTIFDPSTNCFDFCKLVEFCQLNNALGLGVDTPSGFIWYSRVRGTIDSEALSWKAAWLQAADKLMSMDVEYKHA